MSFRAAPHPLLVPPGDPFPIATAATRSPSGGKSKDWKDKLESERKKLGDFQHKLYAHNRYAVLVIFQALDAAGKDGTIRAILTGVNPMGCQVFAYKAPSSEELDHDFMWRCYRNLPERGRIGVWNRSHYEEVIVVRVHPNYLDGQRLPRKPASLEQLWQERFESINAMEQHWARNGLVVLKFFLNVSQKEQHERFFDRVSDPDVHWKFNAGDLDESRHWTDYQTAYQAALRATSKPWAPWYTIPADAKPYMRRAVAEIVVDTLKQLDVPPPQLSDKDRLALEKAKVELAAAAKK